jgi:NTE family protein
MSGGGARAAYQVGVIDALTHRLPDLKVDILTGVSAGAINAAYLASHPGSLSESAQALCQLWLSLRTQDVFRTDWRSLFGRVLRSGAELLSGGRRVSGGARGMVDTEPLRRFLRNALDAEPKQGELSGVRRNLDRGLLKAVAITTSSYTTGQSVTWVEGREIEPWQRAHRVGRTRHLSVEHVMASASLPLFFPAVELEQEWHGDGGIRLSAPLSPAVHLGAQRILAISTRHRGHREATPEQKADGYPPPAQIAGSLMNALFLDLFDGDALRLQRINELVEGGVGHPGEARLIDLLLLRPSRDLGDLANAYEARLPGVFRFLTRGLGTRETRSNDLLSLVMFQNDYLKEIIELGRVDAENRLDEIVAFVTR